MKIRKYRFEDAEAHAEIHKKSVRKIASKDYSDKIIEAWSDREPESSPLDEEKERFVAEKDGQIIGFSDFNKETNELSGLYVKPGYTGRKVGSKLLQKVEKLAKKKGLEKLWCKSTTTARGFYEEHGWTVLEETVHEVKDVEMKVFRMEKELC